MNKIILKGKFMMVTNIIGSQNNQCYDPFKFIVKGGKEKRKDKRNWHIIPLNPYKNEIMFVMPTSG